MKNRTITIKSVYISAMFALIPYILGNMYLTLVVNWPSVTSQLGLLELDKMGKIAQINFYFCFYALYVVALLFIKQWVGYFIVYLSIFIGFLMGIGLLYSVVVALQPVVNSYISAAILINTLVGIYGMAVFHYELVRDWVKSLGKAT